MKKSIYAIAAAVIICAAVFLAVRHFNAAGGKSDVGQISEKDFTTTVGGSLGPGREDKSSFRKVYLPIRLKISDINNVLGIVTVQDILFRSGVALILILMILVIISFLKEMISRSPPLSPYERAMKTLAQIDPEKARPADAVKEFYFLMSRAIRQYLKDILGFGGQELTAREFSAKLDETAIIPENVRSAAKDLILRCERIKFSGDTAGIDELKNDLKAVKELAGAINDVLMPKGGNK